MGAALSPGKTYRKEAGAGYFSITIAMTGGEVGEEGRVSFVLVSERTQAIMLGGSCWGSSKLWWREHETACSHLWGPKSRDGHQMRLVYKSQDTLQKFSSSSDATSQRLPRQHQQLRVKGLNTSLWGWGVAFYIQTISGQEESPKHSSSLKKTQHGPDLAPSYPHLRDSSSYLNLFMAKLK